MPIVTPWSVHYRRVVWASVAAAVILTACSASSNDATGATSSPRTTPAAPPTAPSTATVPSDSVATPTTDAAEDRSGDETTSPPATDAEVSVTTTPVEATIPESPLTQYISGGTFGNTDFDPAQAERESRAHEEAIARCMADEGFEYVPYVQAVFQWNVVAGGVAIVSAGAGTLPDLPPDEFAAQYGYGLSTRDASEVEDTDVDPNAAIVDAMSIPERVAYYQALLGADQSLDDQGRPNAEMPGDPQSCWEQAATEVWGDQSASPASDQVLAAFAPLLDQIAAIEDQIAADPRMVAENTAWSTCMADAGFPGYTDLNAPQSDVAARARDVMGTAMDPANADPDELADLQHFEIAIATADNRCREGYGDTYWQVRHDIETRFVEQHRTELEQYRDALAAEAG